MLKFGNEYNNNKLCFVNKVKYFNWVSTHRKIVIANM